MRPPFRLNEGLSIDLSRTEGPSQFDGYTRDFPQPGTKFLQLDVALAFEYVEDVIDQELALSDFCL